MGVELPDATEAKAAQFDNDCQLVDESLRLIREAILAARSFPVMVHAGPAFNFLVEEKIKEALRRAGYKTRLDPRSSLRTHYIMPIDDAWPSGSLGLYPWEAEK